MVGRSKGFLIVAACLLLAVCSPVSAKTWRALVIGNQAYQGGRLGELDNPVRDAEALADVLERLGFEVTLHRNVTKNQFWEVFQAFKQALKAESSEVALFFFSGHGLAADRSNYLMPVDAKPEYLEDVAFHGIPMERVLGDIKTEGVRLRMIVVDACRDNANLKSKYRGGGNPGLVSMRAPVGTLIAFSAGPSQQAWDYVKKGDKHSPYMAALLKYLPEPGLTAKEVFLKAGEEVAVMTGEKQIPSLQTSLVEQFRFNLGRGGDERRDRVEPEGPERVAVGGSTPSPFRPSVPEEAPPAGSRPPSGQVFRDTLSDGTRGPAMVVIPAGEFQMGSPASEPERGSNERQHPVRVARFAMGQYEVTVGEFRRFVEASGYRTDAEKNGEGCYAWKDSKWRLTAGLSWRNPGFKQGDDHPVVCVSWNDANHYAEWLTQQTGQTYQLPMEAEWEYAARAGTTAVRYWGENPNQACQYANVADQTKSPVGNPWTHPHACTDGYWYPAPVGLFQPNGWKLYDMLGNVWEWTCSAYAKDYDRSEAECAEKGTTGPLAVRGGAWSDMPAWVRSAARSRGDPTGCAILQGFRLARSL